MAEICISLASPTIDTTTAPDIAFAMRTSIITHPPLKHRYPTLPRPIIVDAVENMPLH
jgi:hypothetical protein